ncbi:MAG: dTMP kinase [bacterium]|nr:dTMP kinase [bacterium]
MSARFITFEGPDGSGKSTHLRRAARWMQDRGLEVQCTKEPGGTPLGEGIRELFLDRRLSVVDGKVEALLIFASRRQHLEEVIEPALAAGRHVLCDRFTDSSLAYQGVGRGLSLGWVEELDRLATDGRRPDHTLLFDLPAEAAFERGRSAIRRKQPGGLDRLDAENLAFYRRVREGFLALAEREPQRFHIIDSSREASQTWDRVELVLGDLLGVGR